MSGTKLFVEVLSSSMFVFMIYTQVCGDYGVLFSKATISYASILLTGMAQPNTPSTIHSKSVDLKRSINYMPTYTLAMQVKLNKLINSYSAPYVYEIIDIKTVT